MDGVTGVNSMKWLIVPWEITHTASAPECSIRKPKTAAEGGRWKQTHCPSSVSQRYVKQVEGGAGGCPGHSQLTGTVQYSGRT